MSELIEHKLVVGPLQCNCILLACERTQEAVLIDPGAEADRIVKLVQEQGVQVRYLLHTHAHFDHIGATAAVTKRLGAVPCLHSGDTELYNNLPLQGRMFGMEFGEAPPVGRFFEQGEELAFGDHRLEVIHTPGHSPGSVCFKLVGADERVFSGDTLFRQSVGRADLWGGDARQLIHSIRDRLMVLQDDTRVIPGHGPDTEIGFERRSNPFLIR